MELDPKLLSDEYDLSEEQIEQLLQQVEARLRSEAQPVLPARNVIQRTSKLDLSVLPRPYVQMNGHIARAESRRLIEDKDRKLAGAIRKVEDPVAMKQNKLKEKKATAGSNWFNLPKTNLTPEMKRDLQLIRMRGVLDPHRHYKKDNDRGKVPEFSQVGTVIEGPTEYYSARMQNAERKRTLVEDVLVKERENGKFKRKYNDIQSAKTSGKKGHYKAQMAKKYGNRASRSKFRTS